MEYVVGFMFSEDKKSVALIRKNRPEWQAGKLNGIGGKVEPTAKDGYCEGYYGAMEREFEEEAGVHVTDWKMFCNLFGDWGSVKFFKTTGDLSGLVQIEEEEVVVVSVEDLPQLNIIPNLLWLIPMALDKSNLFARVNDEVSGEL